MRISISATKEGPHPELVEGRPPPMRAMRGWQSYLPPTTIKRTPPPLAGVGRGRGFAPAGANESISFRLRCDGALPRADLSPYPLPQGEGEFFFLRIDTKRPPRRTPGAGSALLFVEGLV